MESTEREKKAEKALSCGIAISGAIAKTAACRVRYFSGATIVIVWAT